MSLVRSCTSRYTSLLLPVTKLNKLSYNGIPFTNRKKDQWAWAHIFDRVCHEHKIEHRLTKVNHPWTNGQVERMNRTLKEANVKRSYYESHQQLKEPLSSFLKAYNFAKRLKALKGLTPYEYIIKCWQSNPEKFKLNPNHHNAGLYTVADFLSSGYASSVAHRALTWGARSL